MQQSRNHLSVMSDLTVAKSITIACFEKRTAEDFLLISPITKAKDSRQQTTFS